MTEQQAAGVDAEAVGGGEAVGVPTASQAVMALASVLARRQTVHQAGALVGALGQVLTARSTLAPNPRDRRFTDPAWSQNPLFRRIGQTYLAATRALDTLVDEFATHTGDHRTAQRARFAADIVIAATAPTNLLLTNPAGLKRALDTGGASMLRGARNLVTDLRHNGGLPATADRSAFAVGRDLALTPGAVVNRDEMAELIHYTASTPKTHRRPLLIVPPPIGRYYFLDLRPGRSFVEFAVGQQLNTFLLSWRNPGPQQGHWDLDDYAATVSAAIDHVRAITGSADVNLMGFCAGGIINAALLSHLATVDDNRVHSASFAVTLLDFSEKAPLAAFNDRTLLDLVRRRSRRARVITARQLGAAFTWMRPDDLVFNYVVNNYVLGEQPPVFDILAWNADGTNLPGTLHATFLDMFQHNKLVEPGSVTVLGTPVDIGKITIPVFVTGAVSDHLTPWKACYRTTQLVGGDSTFVLSHSGHIASLVNPPGNPKAHYWEGEPDTPDPDTWLSRADRRDGSWWQPWAKWLTERSGDLADAATTPGDANHPSLGPAPGRYVTAPAAS